MRQQVQLARERPPLRSKLCSSHRQPPALLPAEATGAALHLQTGLAKRFNRIANRFLNPKKILQTRYFCLFFFENPKYLVIFDLGQYPTGNK